MADITNSINVWDLQTGNLVRSLSLTEQKASFNFCAYSPKADLLASTVTKAGGIVIISPGRPGLSLTLQDRHGRLALSPDGKLLANFSNRALCVWELEVKGAKEN